MDINKIIDENYIDLIIQNDIIDLYGPAEDVTPLNTRHSMLHVLSSEVDMCDISKYPYHFFPSIYTLCSTESLEKSGIIRIQNNPNLSLYGNGVIVGVIDTGIDYLHQAFRNNDNTTRILSIWDQTIHTDDLPLPQGLYYGTEYTKDRINEALNSDDPLAIVPTTDDNGHGTMIAGIIAGNENTQANFSGVVPQSEIVVVKLKQAKKKNRQIHAINNRVLCFEESDIITSVKYIYDFAKKLARPLALCIALGSSQGGHDGRGALSIYISSLSQTPHVGILVAAGNEGNNQRHYQGFITAGAESTTTFQLSVSETDSLFAFELWQAAPYRLMIGITSPSGETVEDIYPRLNLCRRINFIFETTTLWVNNIISESETGDQLILLRFSKPMPGVWTFQITNIDKEASTFHAWLPSGNIISNETFFLQASPNTTVTSPGNAVYAITITAYNQENDSILLTSSRGFTRSGKIKPDLSAPGFNLTCPMVGNLYGSITGTGAAAAHATGIAAMILEWAVIKGNYTSMTGTDISSLFIRGATRSTELTYPNEIWGYGQINIVGLFEKLI